jgi:hypothetical protein
MNKLSTRIYVLSSWKSLECRVIGSSMEDVSPVDRSTELALLTRSVQPVLTDRLDFRFLVGISNLRRYVQSCYGEPLSLVSKGNYKDYEYFQRKRGAVNICWNSTPPSYPEITSVSCYNSRCYVVVLRHKDNNQVICPWPRCFKPTSHFNIDA